MSTSDREVFMGDLYGFATVSTALANCPALNGHYFKFTLWIPVYAIPDQRRTTKRLIGESRAGGGKALVE